jgi:hypothetical protein
MHSTFARQTALGFFLLTLVCVRTDAAQPVHGLSAAARDGQVFLTWQEDDTPPGTTFNVYMARQPIADLAGARLAAHHVEPHSARDWWQDPASFAVGKPAGQPVGYTIESHQPALDPKTGLFVYTVPAREKASLFFAVTSTNASGREETTIEPHVNTLALGVLATPGAIRPIWQRGEPMPQRGAGKDLPLWLNLHAKGGVVPDSEYLVFGDETLGWRAGLPFKFSVRVQGKGDQREVVVRPTDRVWINRPHKEAADGGTPAIWTFWYGYNSKIYDRALMSTGTPTNYTERRVLWILNFVRDYYQPNPNRCYCSGSSMGGCGTISFGLRHPELFAALHAHVPIVSYTYLGRGSATRFEPSCWVGRIPPDLKTADGVSLLEEMNGAEYVRKATVDLPPLFMINGRQDGSIPWENNPPFYRALEDARQPFAAFWDNGTHATSGKDAPPDVKDWLQRFKRFRLDESYPVFSHTSSDRDPGQGRPDDGDVIGWMNRGLDYKEIQDTPDRYAITLLADYPGMAYPVTTGVTLRRVQQFKVRPGQRLRVQIGDAPPIATEVDAAGRITIAKVAIPSAAGVRVTVRRDE